MENLLFMEPRTHARLQCYVRWLVEDLLEWLGRLIEMSEKVARKTTH